MRASLIALGVAVGLAVPSFEAVAQQPAGVPGASALPAAPEGLQGVQSAIQGALPGEAIVSPAYPYPTAPVVGSAPILDGDLATPPHPYSYYVTFPAPARTYVEYGAMDQFPFQGQAYGNPGDRWSWSGMMGSRAAGLDRYYYQLLP